MIDSISQYRKVRNRWVRIPAREEQPFGHNAILDKRIRVKKCCTYALTLMRNRKFKLKGVVKAVIKFRLSDANGRFEKKATYIHE